MNNVKLQVIIPNGEVSIVRIYDIDKDKRFPIGNVIICTYDDYVEVIHIFVQIKYRGQGYAQCLIKYLQSNYDYIITGWEDSENKGRELFMKMGFKLKRSLFKTKLSTLEWINE